MLCEPNYLTALEYYHQNGFHFISLGDCEELWENTLSSVKREHAPAFRSEQQFILQMRSSKSLATTTCIGTTIRLHPFS
jgi:hypothetical protein